MLSFKLYIGVKLTNLATLSRTVIADTKDGSPEEMCSIEQAEFDNLLSCVKGESVVSRTVKWTRLN